jgi:hypothetical protein
MPDQEIGAYGAVLVPNEVERRRVQTIGAVFDDNTFAHLGAIGVGAGWRCLEVGAGSGSVARWLAGRAGQVVATDLDTRFVDVPDGVQVLRHDITRDPRPGGHFDLVHTRHVLTHLPEREPVIDRLVEWLHPGGWLLVEETFVTPALASSSLMGRCLAALVSVLADRVGTDLTWALTLPRPLRARGLTAIGSAAFLPRAAPAGRPGPSALGDAWRLTFEQLMPAMAAAGLLTREDEAALAAELDDHEAGLYAIGVVSAWGRRPGPTRTWDAAASPRVSPPSPPAGRTG